MMVKTIINFLVCFVKRVLGIITYALYIANSYAALL